jgi:hypothetical protein
MKPRLILALLLTLVVTAAATAGELDQRTGLGALQGLPTFFNSTAQSTTPVKATIVNASATQAVRAKICNGDAANVLAWSIVLEGAAAPTITADYASTGASPIFAGHCEFVPLQGDRDLYIVASAASTEVSVTSFIVQ